MANTSIFGKSPTEMTDEELQSRLLDIRKARRAPTEVRKKTVKVTTVKQESISSLTKAITPEQALELLNTLGLSTGEAND